MKNTASEYEPIVRMTNQAAAIGLNLSSVAQDYPSLSYVEITSNDERAFLSGKVIYKGQNNNDSAYYLDAIPTENVSNKVRLTNLSTDKENYIAIPAQTLSNGLTVQLFDASGTSLLTRSSSREIALSQGRCIILKM